MNSPKIRNRNEALIGAKSFVATDSAFDDISIYTSTLSDCQQNDLQAIEEFDCRQLGPTVEDAEATDGWLGGLFDLGQIFE